jgi:thiamine monophosphate synthase
VAGTVVDPTITFVPLSIKGRTLHLCYDFFAIAQAEKLCGANLLQGIGGVVLYTMTAAQFLGLFYAALGKAQPKMTIEEAASLMDVDTMPDIRTALLEAYGVSMPEEKKPDPPAADAPAES